MNNIVHNCDCMDYMKTCKNNQFDLAIVDPPYGIGDFRQDFGKANTSKNKYKSIEWNNIIPDKKYFDELFRISKNHIIFGFQYYQKFMISKGVIIHNKKVPLKCNLSMADIACTSLFNKVVLYDYTWHGMLQENMKNKQIRIHPCEKPIALYKWILFNFAKKCNNIFDSHVGSGSIRIACYDLNFEFTGCEINKDYWKEQDERYNSYIKQLKLL